MIQKGGFGTVYEGKRIQDQASVIIKKIHRKDVVAYGAHENLEIEILLKLKNIPSIIDLLDYQSNQRAYYLVFETFGPDMFQYIREHGQFSENDAKYIFRQLVNTVGDMQNMHVLHGDLKIENVLYKDRRIKVIDLGAASYFHPGQYHRFYGTNAYAPPEWFTSHQYTGEGLNVWSLGILVMTLIIGDIPFPEDYRGEEQEDLFVNCSLATAEYRNMVNVCLDRNPKTRTNLATIANHMWLSPELSPLIVTTQ